MSLRNVFEAAGSPSDPDFDFTVCFANILADGDSVYVPVRKDTAGSVTPYIVKNLSPPSDSVIKCESPYVQIQAGDPEAWIMDIVGGVHRLHISGGTWGKKSHGVLRHRRLTSGSLTTSIFERMLIEGGLSEDNLNRGFQIGSCAGIVWRDVRFREISRYGILFQVENGYATTNTVDNCKFQNVLGPAIYFTHSGDAQHKAGNRISGCWFENSGLTDPHGAIRTKGYHYSLIVERCYFEATGSGSFADIHLEDSTDANGVVHTIRSVVIRDNMFANPNPSQDCRIRNVGRASYAAMDNHVHTRYSDRLADHQHFASCEGVQAGGRDYKVWLLRNLVHYRGTRELFELDDTFMIDLNNGILTDELLEEFGNADFPLSPSATLSIIAVDSRWSVRDVDETYTIRNEEGTLKVFGITNRPQDYDDAVRVITQPEDQRQAVEIESNPASAGFPL